MRMMIVARRFRVILCDQKHVCRKIGAQLSV